MFLLISVVWRRGHKGSGKEARLERGKGNEKGLLVFREGRNPDEGDQGGGERQSHMEQGEHNGLNVTIRTADALVCLYKNRASIELF